MAIAPGSPLGELVERIAPGASEEDIQKLFRNVEQTTSYPSNFAWNYSKYPVNIYKDGPRHFTTDFDPVSSVFPTDYKSWPVYYVNLVSGNNTNAGTSRGTAFKSLWKARQVGEANASAPGYVIISVVQTLTGRAFADRNNDFNDTGGAGGGGIVIPTKPFVLLSEGGTTGMGPVSAPLTWTYDTTTRTYTATRGGVAAVVDFSAYNSYGTYNRMVRVTAGADLATTQTTVQAAVTSTGVSSYSQSGTSVVVRFANDLEPTVNNIRVILQFTDGLRMGNQSAWVSGFQIVGGSGSFGAVDAYGTGTRNLLFDDCDFSFAGTDGGVSRNNIVVDNMTGLVTLRRCSGSSSTNDIFNYHAAGSTLLHALMIDCTGIDAGRVGASPVTASNQIVTLHENVSLISLNTKGYLSAGGVVRNINQSQHWDLGSEYGYDRGDLHLGGNVPSGGVIINDQAKYWGDSITVKGCGNSFIATAGTEIRLRDTIEIGCGPRIGTGLITTY